MTSTELHRYRAIGSVAPGHDGERHGFSDGSRGAPAPRRARRAARARRAPAARPVRAAAAASAPVRRTAPAAVARAPSGARRAPAWCPRARARTARSRHRSASGPADSVTGRSSGSARIRSSDRACGLSSAARSAAMRDPVRSFASSLASRLASGSGRRRRAADDAPALDRVQPAPEHERARPDRERELSPVVRGHGGEQIGVPAPRPCGVQRCRHVRVQRGPATRGQGDRDTRRVADRSADDDRCLRRRRGHGHEDEAHAADGLAGGRG